MGRPKKHQEELGEGDPAAHFRAVVRMALDHVVKYRGTPLSIAAVTLIACARREYRAELKRRKITVH